MLKILLSLISALLLMLCGSSYASEYSQPDFYNVTHYTLDNGLSVILKPRHAAKNVSIRLKVDVGEYSFKCGKKETAHYLEHLLFTGTSKHKENELDDIIESHGGSWNATTRTENTTYELDIYSKHLDVGLTTLHEIITDSLISSDNVKKSLNIIRRELGGKPSVLRSWLYRNEYIYSSVSKAMNALFSNPPWICAEIDHLSSITRQEIVDAYKKYYTPDNMTLSIVGNFNLEKTKKHINMTFGSIDRFKNYSRYEIPVPKVNDNLDSSIIFSGRFKPLLRTDAEIYQIYRAPNKHHKDKIVLDVLAEYFNRELYKYLRVEKGTAYSPSSDLGSYDKFGFLLLTADSEIDDIETNINYIGQVVEKFKNGDLDDNELKETKLKMLLYEARGYETNASFSDYYVANEFELKIFGHFISYVDEIEKVSLADIQRVSKKYFHEGNRVIAVTSPTLTYTQFYIVVLVMIVLVSVLVWRIVLRVRLKKK